MPDKNKIPVKLPPYTTSVIFAKSNVNTDWSHNFYDILKIHEKGKRGEGVKIAVLDTGVDVNHSSFTKAVNEGRLKAYDARKGVNKPLDRAGHGTWCVSRYISDSEHVLGFSPDSTVISYKVLNDNGTGKLINVERGIRMAIDEGVNIINTSLGWNSDAYPILRELAKEAEDKGILWLSASGNDGDNEGIDYPAIYKEVISVGSHNIEGRRSSFSDFGVALDLYSSGEEVLGAYTDDREAYLKGTSMATPSLGGLIALMYDELLEKYGKIDRNILKNISKCQ